MVAFSRPTIWFRDFASFIWVTNAAATALVVCSRSALPTFASFADAATVSSALAPRSPTDSTWNRLSASASGPVPTLGARSSMAPLIFSTSAWLAPAWVCTRSIAESNSVASLIEATAATPDAMAIPLGAFSAPAPRVAYAPLPSACVFRIAAPLSRLAAINWALSKRSNPTTGGRKSPGTLKPSGLRGGLLRFGHDRRSTSTAAPVRRVHRRAAGGRLQHRVAAGAGAAAAGAGAAPAPPLDPHRRGHAVAPDPMDRHRGAEPPRRPEEGIGRLMVGPPDRVGPVEAELDPAGVDHCGADACLPAGADPAGTVDADAAAQRPRPHPGARPAARVGPRLPLDHQRRVPSRHAGRPVDPAGHRLQRRDELGHAEQVELKGGHPVTSSAGVAAGRGAAAPRRPARRPRRSPGASRTAVPAPPPPPLRSSRRCGRAGRCGSGGGGPARR